MRPWLKHLRSHDERLEWAALELEVVVVVVLESPFNKRF